MKRIKMNVVVSLGFELVGGVKSGYFSKNFLFHPRDVHQSALNKTLLDHNNNKSNKLIKQNIF